MGQLDSNILGSLFKRNYGEEKNKEKEIVNTE